MSNSLYPENDSGSASYPPEFFGENMLRLSQAARRLPAIRSARSGDTVERPPHPSTLVRWWKVGLKSRAGKIVRLHVRKVGSANCTSLEALARFFDELDDLHPVEPPKSPAQVDAALRRQAEHAMKILRERGLLE